MRVLPKVAHTVFLGRCCVRLVEIFFWEFGPVWLILVIYVQYFIRVEQLLDDDGVKRVSKNKSNNSYPYNRILWTTVGGFASKAAR